MFHLGMPEIALILGAALLIFGPARLPELGRAAGKLISEFRGASRKREKAAMNLKEGKEGVPSGSE